MISQELTDRLRIDIAKMRDARSNLEAMRKNGATDKEIEVAWQRYVEECVGFGGVITFLDERCNIIVSFKDPS